MPTKDKAKAALYNRRWYQRNPTQIKKHITAMKAERRTQARAFARTVKLACASCGEADFACLDFHHRSGKEKDLGVSLLLSGNYSLARVMKEIAKCDVLCSNCHRKLHFYENGF